MDGYSAIELSMDDFVLVSETELFFLVFVTTLCVIKTAINIVM